MSSPFWTPNPPQTFWSFVNILHTRVLEMVDRYGNSIPSEVKFLFIIEKRAKWLPCILIYLNEMFSCIVEAMPGAQCRSPVTSSLNSSSSKTMCQFLSFISRSQQFLLSLQNDVITMAAHGVNGVKFLFSVFEWDSSGTGLHTLKRPGFLFCFTFFHLISSRL